MGYNNCNKIYNLMRFTNYLLLLDTLDDLFEINIIHHQATTDLPITDVWKSTVGPTQMLTTDGPLLKLIEIDQWAVQATQSASIYIYMYSIHMLITFKICSVL